MRTVICKGCGKIVQLSGQRYLCDDCAKAAKRATVVRPRVCASCGVTFSGGPKAKYCPACREENKRRIYREYAHRKAAGTNRKIGSTDICARCGAEYTVMGGRQKYCPACADEGVKEQVRPHKREYARQHREDYTARKAAAKTDRKVCVVCGKPFTTQTPTVTCSDECAREQRRRRQGMAEYKRGRRKSPPGEASYDSGLPKSGIVGVTARRNGKWQAAHKGHYLGIFDTIEAAASTIETYKRSLDT